MSKPKFAMYWAASCGGCEIAVLNIHEKILDVDANFEVVFWPVAMDAKYKDVEAMEDGSITLCLFNGGMRNDENEHIARLMRKKSKILVAFGSCACEGCIPGLGNFSNVKGVGAGVFEYVLNFGPGYRLYFGKDGERIVILLAGGTKKRQQRDIQASQARWQDYKDRKTGKA